MNLDFSDDQQVLHDTLDDFFQKESPVSAVRCAEPLGFDPALWHKVAELGLPGIAVSEELGGGGGGLVELGIAAEMLGRSLAPVPLVEAAVATTLLAVVGEQALVRSVVGGEQLASLAIYPAVNGVARFVPGGAVADVVVVLHDHELVLVRQSEKPAPLLPNLGAMPLAHCPINGSTPVVLARGPEATALYRRAVAQWQALTAVALVGLAIRAQEIGIGYVLGRRAFGVLIGSFQTIQHRLADNATALVGARLLAYKALWAQDLGLPEAEHLAGMSLLFAADTAFKTASDSLHFHGGYGYTLEYDIQLYFRRAKAWSLLAGDRRKGYAALAHHLFDEEG